MLVSCRILLKPTEKGFSEVTVASSQYLLVIITGCDSGAGAGQSIRCQIPDLATLRPGVSSVHSLHSSLTQSSGAKPCLGPPGRVAQPGHRAVPDVKICSPGPDPSSASGHAVSWTFKHFACLTLFSTQGGVSPLSRRHH